MTEKFRKPVTIQIHNVDQSYPMYFTDVDNTYVKEGFYCIVRRHKNQVQKLNFVNFFHTRVTNTNHTLVYITHTS